MNTSPTLYTVLIDDNAHYMDETHRVQDLAFNSLEEATVRCQAITNASLDDLYEEGMTVLELFLHYTQFGKDPWVSIEPHDGSPPPFSARTYAQARCIEICTTPQGITPTAGTPPVDDLPRGLPSQVFAMLAGLIVRKVREIADDEGLLRRTLHNEYPLVEETSLEPDSEEAAGAATTDERTMHIASLTWARLRPAGQAVLIESMKKAVWRWEEVVELMKLWEPHELPEDREVRLQQEALEEREWREQQNRQDNAG